MMSGGQLMYVGFAMTVAADARFSSLSRYSLDRCSAFRMAFTVFGFFVANSSVNAQTFSGWSFHIFCVVTTVNPILSAIARAFHGSPTQNPSILSTFIFATICGGGIVMRFTSLSGWMPPAPNQYRVHIACVPGGKVMAKLSGSPDALALSAIGFRSLAFLTPAFSNLLLSVMAWPLRFSIHGMTMGL